MKKFACGLKFFFSLLTFAAAPATFGGIFNFFDVDGTLMHDSGVDHNGKLPAWRMYWILERVSHVNGGFHTNDLAAIGALPPRVYLTKHEVDMYRHLFAKGDERVGDVRPVRLASDPIRELESQPTLSAFRPAEFVPGYYKVVLDVTFNDHRDFDGVESTLPLRLRNSISRMEADPTLDFRGTAFPYFVEAIRKQGPEHRVVLLTDQERRQSSVDEMMNIFFQRGFIGNPFPRAMFLGQDKTFSPRLISTTNAEARKFGSFLNEFDFRKANAVLSYIYEALRSPVPMHWTLSPDNYEASRGTLKPMHEFRIFENRPIYVKNMVDQFKANAGRMPNAKICIFYAGDLSEIAAIAPPYDPGPIAQRAQGRWFIVTPSNSGLRVPTSEELQELEPRSSHADTKATSSISCAAISSGGQR